MKAIEKAEEIVDKMYNIDFNDDAREISMRYPHAVKCALIAVDEMLKTNWINVWEKDYWEQVKQEIKAL